MGDHGEAGRRRGESGRFSRGAVLASSAAVVAALALVAPPSQVAARATSAASSVGASLVMSTGASAAVTADPVIAVAGDNACGRDSAGATCREMATSDLLVGMQANDRLDAVIPLGDVQYECGELANFLLADGSSPPRGYDRSWGRVKGLTTPAIGNHEYRTDPTACLPQAAGAPGYFTYFGPAGSPLDQSCTTFCKAYYSYDLGSWHVVVLNSNCGQVPSGGCGVSGAQAQWLRADLAANSRQCIAAAFHHPRYSSSTRATAGTQALWEILYDAGADVVLTGHEHSYERFAKLGRGPTATDSLQPVLDPNGMRQFVVGTGGRNLSSFAGSVRTGSEVRNSTTFGVLRMVLHDTSYDWNFVPIAGQTFTDVGSTPCNGTTGSGDGQAPSVPTGLVASPSSTQVGLSWSASTDNVGVTGYDVWRDGAFRGAVSAPSTSFTDSSVSAGSTYSYQVLARDAAGNTSALSAALPVLVPVELPPGTFAPVADARVQEGAPSNNYASTLLRADGGVDPDVESLVRFSVSGLTEPVQSAVLRVFATNGSGDGPGVFVTSSAWSESTVTWGNRPPRSTSPFVDKAAISGGTFVDYDVTSQVTGNGTYDWVFAGTSSDGTDFDSREMANPPRLVVTTGPADTTSPDVPADLSAVALESTRVDLSWSAAADDVGVTGYDVWRDGAFRGAVSAPSTSFTDSSVSAGSTYSYQVLARDAAGNVSGLSPPESVTTPAPPVVVIADADARVVQSKASTNYAASYLRTGTTRNSADVESHLRFTVSGLSGTVLNARLSVFVTSGSVDGPGVYGTSNAWSESTLTWSNRPVRSTTAIADVLTATTGTWLDYDVTPYVTGNGTFSVALATGSTDATDLGSRETANPPRLGITTTTP